MRESLPARGKKYATHLMCLVSMRVEIAKLSNKFLKSGTTLEMKVLKACRPSKVGIIGTTFSASHGVQPCVMQRGTEAHRWSLRR